MDPRNSVALVTGGGTGLGRAICLKLAAAGCKVAVGYLSSRENVDETVAEIAAIGGEALAVHADVSSSEDVQRMIDFVTDGLGSIDILVNNAATRVIVPFNDLDALKEEDWDRIIAVNLRGPFLCAKAVAPAMKRRGAGKIINVTSIGGIRPGGSSLAYSVSKAGEEMLGRCLAVALAPEVQVNNIAPGLMDTPAGRLLGEEWWQNYIDGALLKRMPLIDDVADAALYFVRNDSVTAQTAAIDGGVLTY